MVNGSKVGALVALLLGAASACGVKDLNFTYENAAGSGGEGTGPGAGGSGAGEAAEVPASCRQGEKRCSGNTPQTCETNGDWVDGKACSGTNRVCTGAGVCAAYRLVNSGIDSLGERPPEKQNLVLKQQTLASSARHCAKSGVCITGAIR